MMPTSAQLKQKAQGFVDSIRQMSDRERSRQPSNIFATDYNRLRDMTATTHSELEQVLPPKVTFYNASDGELAVNESYNDIWTFCQQIVNLLP